MTCANLCTDHFTVIWIKSYRFCHQVLNFEWNIISGMVHWSMAGQTAMKFGESYNTCMAGHRVIKCSHNGSGLDINFLPEWQFTYIMFGHEWYGWMGASCMICLWENNLSNNLWKKYTLQLSGYNMGCINSLRPSDAFICINKLAIIG